VYKNSVDSGFICPLFLAVHPRRFFCGGSLLMDWGSVPEIVELDFDPPKPSELFRWRSWTDAGFDPDGFGVTFAPVDLSNLPEDY